MKVDIYNKDRVVVVKVSHFGWNFEFPLEMENSSVAYIVRSTLEEAFQKRTEAVRRRAYEAGKRAARGKQKVQEFSDCFNSHVVGWDKNWDDVE